MADEPHRRPREVDVAEHDAVLAEAAAGPWPSAAGTTSPTAAIAANRPSAVEWHESPARDPPDSRSRMPSWSVAHAYAGDEHDAERLGEARERDAADGEELVCRRRTLERRDDPEEGERGTTG